MKKVLYLAFIAAAFTACSKKNNTPPAKAATSVVISGTTYPTVVIGSQTWTSVNYNGPGGENYNNSATNVAADGKLYTMAEAQAIALPAGWRLPAAADYNQLLIGLGGTPFSLSENYTVSQTVALQLMSTTGWTGTEGNNQLGFNARPDGDFNGSAQGFEGAGIYAFFLNNTPPTNTNVEPLTFEVTPDQTAVYPFLIGANTRWSVRFVKDN